MIKKARPLKSQPHTNKYYNGSQNKKQIEVKNINYKYIFYKNKYIK